MTVINQNSISGITSITAASGSVQIFNSDGSSGSLTDLSGVNVSGVVTATRYRVGTAVTIDASGISATAGVVTATTYRVSAGSAAAPSITPPDDTNTGIFFPSADTIAFAEGGAEAARIDSSGRFGIGTTSPGRLLSVQGIIGAYNSSGANDNQLLVYNNGTSSFIHSTYGTTGGYTPLVFDVGSTERARIDTSGRLLVGTSSNNTSFGSGIQIAGTAADATQLISRYVNSSGGPQLYFSKSRNGTVGSNTIVQVDDQLGFIGFYGANGTTYDGGASIAAFVDGTPGSSSDMPGRLVFSTTADGASSPTEAMRISRFQDVGIGVAPSAGLRLQVRGVDGSSSNSALYVTDSSNAMLCQIRNDGAFYTGLSPLSPYNLTTVAAANCAIISDGTLRRSTSSIQYKTNIETLSDNYADAILKCRPVWYRSTAPGDTAHPNWGYWGFIAEEVAEVDLRLVFWKTHETKRDEDGKETSVELEKPLAEGVQYDRFVPHLLNLIKRQKEQIEAMEARLSALEGA